MASNGRTITRRLEHLAFDFDIADSSAYFTAIDGDDAAPGSPGGKRVPEAVGLVVSSGVTLHDYKRFSGSLRLRAFGPRDLTSDGIYQLKCNGFAQCGGPLSNYQKMEFCRRSFEFAEPQRSRH